MRRKKEYIIKDFDAGYELRLGKKDVMLPGARILNQSTTIGIVSNGLLLPKKLELRKRDNNPIIIRNGKRDLIYNLDYPGKSAVLVLQTTIDRITVGGIVETLMNRSFNRRDKLHTATVKEIESTGWTVYWAPLSSTNSLHVRIVPKSSLSDETFNKAEAEQLQSVFSKVV